MHSSLWRKMALLAVGAALLWLLWKPLMQAAAQALSGAALALGALPVMRRLEKKLPCGAAAAISIAGLFAAVILTALLLFPPLLRQGKQLVQMLPGFYETAEEWLLGGQTWLRKRGLEAGLAFSERMGDVLRALLVRAAAWVGSAASGLGRFLLAPVFAYYFLRDRKTFADRLLFCLPSRHRDTAVRILREMRRETAAYLRGQLMVSAIAGVLTAAGLLACGVPAWLVLGLLMGVLELIPYAGPVIGGAVAVLFSLPLGMGRTLWALGVMIAVQQLEGSVLSPKLMSGATRLHPAAVLLCMVLGGGIGGVSGVLLAVPAALCARAALRVISLQRMEKCRET